MNGSRIAHALPLLGLLISVPVHAQEVENPALATLSSGKVLRFAGHEAISTPFEIEVDLAAMDPSLNFASVVGQQLALTLLPGWTVHAMIESVELAGASGDQAMYRVHLVPAVSKLAYTLNSRTYYEKTTAEIVAEVLKTQAAIAAEFRITRPLVRRELAVQHQESDLAFISRLLEDEGIHYHFEHAPTGHKIVFSDVNTGFPALAKLTFSATAAPAVQSFARGQAMHVGRVQVGDYNWQTPAMDLSAAAQVSLFQNLTERAYPTLVVSKQDSQQRANDRLAAHVIEAQRCAGESTYPRLHAGHRFLLAGHFRPDFNQEYIVTRVDHTLTPRGYLATFECAPFSVLYRTKSATPRPVIAGAVPALVIGPPGQKVYADKFARVRIRFPWRSPDAANSPDVGDSGWVKVAQVATEAGVASMLLPEVGDEVLVAFEHGDLRRPVVIGSLYNGSQPPPESR